MANKVLGMHRLKNKVNRNAFDLSHRHMFTAQVGELLPVFTQWVNPNETFKIGYNGKTRTAALNTDAFTRIRENIQYYFVPFQSLWKYFEQQVNNMTKGDAGQNISKFASSSTESSKITTSMPYISYVDLASWLQHIYDIACNAIDEYFTFTPKDRSAVGFKDFCVGNRDYESVFVCDGYRLCRSAKLLMSLGYGNFTSVIQYDIYALAEAYVASKGSWSLVPFKGSDFGLNFDMFESSSIVNSPNLSLFPLLAYHKICNDHYRNEKWQPFEPWTCNIDYVSPSDNMNAASFISDTAFNSQMTSIIDLENSNLPIDYFTSVLPRAQYGDEAVVPVGLNNADAVIKTSDPLDKTKGFLFDNGSFNSNDNIQKPNTPPTSFDGKSYASTPVSYVTGGKLVGLHGDLSVSASGLKISALRSATALQKYKEIQNSNDPDFANQVLAHFGIKPKVDSRTSIFIGGDDKTLSINPQVNTNFLDGGQPDIKAIGVGDLSAGCKFTASTYGMIIGIYRAIPQLDYSHVGIDRNLFKTDATDFPIPELDSIGMQTQYRCELSAPIIGLCPKVFPVETYNANLDMAVTYGYAPRYAELKSARDYFEGGFCGTYSSWVTGYDPVFLAAWRRNIGLGSLVKYAGINDLFKCRPSLLYPIFVNQWSGTVNDDKLLIGSVNTCVAVRPFSMYGLPYSK
nr:MAG TPA: Major capsid protein [Microviridae sp.]